MATAQAPAPAALRRRIKRKSRALPIVIVGLVLAGIGWSWWTKSHPAEDPNGKMLTATVTRGDLVESVTATGSVTAQTGAEVHIGSQITGTVKKLNADVGTFLRAGEVIAELDLPDLRAQVNQAQSSLLQAQMHLTQDQSGLEMQKTQSSSAVQQAQAALRSAQAKLASAEAAARLQTAQTPTSIDQAKAQVSVSQAALSTAQSNQKQVQASANLQIANAQEQLTQAQANQVNSGLTLQRNQDLLKKGFVAQSVVDAALAADSVNRSLVTAAKQNVQLVREQVTANLASANDQVTQARQQLEASKAALVAAQAGTYNDAAKLADVNDARAAVNQARANLRQALGNTAQDLLKVQDIAQAADAVKVAKAQLDYQQAQYDKSLIRSPISGTVLQLAVQQGETLAAGLSAPTLIIVADLNRLQIDAFVDETDIGKVRLGQEADCTVDAFPKATFRGKIFKIASGSTIQQGVVTYDVSIALDKAELIKYAKRNMLLKPDMTANVTIQTGKRSNVLLVPSEAVKLGVKGSTVNVVTTVDGKKVVTPVKVKTGGSDGVNTEIRDGLKEGQVIVRAGLQDPNKRGFGPQNPFGPSGGKGGGKKG
jgi:HlyD family secretion protein